MTDKHGNILNMQMVMNDKNDTEGKKIIIRHVNELEQELAELKIKLKSLETIADNAHAALVAVRDSGAVREEDVMTMLELGLDNKAQQ